MDIPQAAREQLACSMKEMMRTRPVPQIRIREVCRGSGVRQREFRMEFRSKRRFLEWVFYSEFVPRITRCQGDSSRFLAEVCAYFDENRAIYRTILTPRRRNANRRVRANAKRNALIRSFNLVAPIIARELIEARYADPATKGALLECCPALVEMFRDALFAWLQSDEPVEAHAFSALCLERLDELADVSARFGAVE
ncbi:MAG: hypothetical protein Q4C13_06710 [Clostridia bacterium]|nr:hypothetical protein [Clostridia bacterium]